MVHISHEKKQLKHFNPLNANLEFDKLWIAEWKLFRFNEKMANVFDIIMIDVTSHTEHI